jgi:hypothetical protein
MPYKFKPFGLIQQGLCESPLAATLFFKKNPTSAEAKMGSVNPRLSFR